MWWTMINVVAIAGGAALVALGWRLDDAEAFGAVLAFVGVGLALVAAGVLSAIVHALVS